MAWFVVHSRVDVPAHTRCGGGVTPPSDALRRAEQADGVADVRAVPMRPIGAVLFLDSDAARWITGVVLDVNGGQVIA